MLKHHFFDLLFKNYYPKQLILRIIKNVREKLLFNTQPNNALNNNISHQEITFKSMMYVNGLSEELSSIFKKKNKNLKIAFKSTNTVGKNFFTKIKDKTTNFETSSVVYRVKCLDCENITLVKHAAVMLKRRKNMIQN